MRNLKPVALAIREKYPDNQILICADDDYRSDTNTGLVCGKAAANAVGGRLVVPEFGTDRPHSATDFNDLHRSHGYSF